MRVDIKIFWFFKAGQVKHKEEILYSDSDEALEKVAPRSCEYPVYAQVQVGWVVEKPGLVGGVLFMVDGFYLDNF